MRMSIEAGVIRCVSSAYLSLELPRVAAQRSDAVMTRDAVEHYFKKLIILTFH